MVFSMSFENWNKGKLVYEKEKHYDCGTLKWDVNSHLLN